MALNKKTILIAMLSFLILTGLVYFGLTLILGESKQNLREIEGFPQEDWLRIINIQESGEFKIITNKYDGYQISVPKTWNVPETAAKEGGLTIFFNSTDIPEFVLEPEEGLFLTILTIPISTNTSVQEWLASSEKARRLFPNHTFSDFQETRLGNNVSYQLTTKLIDYNDALELIIFGNSELAHYLISDNRVLYLVSCLTKGENFKTLSNTCTEHIKSFTIIK